MEMFLTIKLCTLALNNLQRLICHKTHQTQTPKQSKDQSLLSWHQIRQTNSIGNIELIEWKLNLITRKPRELPVVLNGLGDPSSNPGLGCLRFT